MPRYLTEQDIADFRARLCEVATERFAKLGYEGVTMRQLAEALGCSPKTPYRYFKDKADILATVRAQAFDRFARALEGAAKAPPGERGRRTTEAYLDFALKNPHAYRIMFDLDTPIDDSHPELLEACDRAATYITRGAEQMAAAGLIDVDPQLFGWATWAALHGIVMLRQSGMLKHGPDYKALSAFHAALMRKGAAPERKRAQKRA
ncbi:transcriptional regulator, TetR family [Enhydrobacter aerosaccus]|uniref:Transcriptional regulator, TetR family n=1 Tax=Enhydrobacter aerosaccus TaxID=225324 RepID=A0A1T4JYJ3_9HYPH|nr:TetR/AcrR family transcriptional regulator [Enhydrobacter aerosaccus]SJZ35250.1 transcriptional regulator, TetR family [Enhydrobacter aerosaccus]